MWGSVVLSVPLPMLEKKCSPPALCLLHLPEALHRGPVCSCHFKHSFPDCWSLDPQTLWLEGQDSPCSVTEHCPGCCTASPPASLHRVWERCPGECPALEPQGMLCTHRESCSCWSCLGHPLRQSPWVKAVRRKLAPFPQGFPSLSLCTVAAQLQASPARCSDRNSALTAFSPPSPHSLPCPVASGLAGALQHHGAFPCCSVFSRGSGS